MIYKGQNDEYLELSKLTDECKLTFDNDLSLPLLFVWIKGDHSEFIYEGSTKQLPHNTILSLSVFHSIEFTKLESARVIKFNRQFYCVTDHDSEVSCKGLLFYGAQQLPYFQIPDEGLEKFELLWKMFEIEMQSTDDLKLEMLQMMLKRFIILSTRLYKAQMDISKLQVGEVDLVREYHYLVEQHFKTKHSVKEYADLLHKSPKTLSNIFSKISEQSPLQIIHERKLLEAKRMLRYTDKPIKAIALELGFDDNQAFSRFFKKSEKISPTEYKNAQEGNIANSSGLLT
tara:strand:- start:1950 stop:2810 length:861 start_codon:yes stop_codon:yes gene_type:complete